MINKVMKCGIVETVLHWAKAKESFDMKKKLKGGATNATRVLGIPKLEDANDAGTKDSEKCTLILTEGDSAKSLAVAGLGIIGRNNYGVFPLKGKLMNVRDANFKQLTQNEEIQNLIKILNLDTSKKYDEGLKGLRYGPVMLMTDQDLDGSHIKGLLMNMFQHWWPTLYKQPGFLKEFVTPIVKVKKSGVSKQFFTLKEYHTWKARNNGGKGGKAKYYKGLGTNTSQEAKEYFKNIAKHEITFQYAGPEDDEAIDLVFNKKRADDRKEWINGANDNDFVDHGQMTLNYSDFVNKELVQYSKYDVLRSIPNMVDGFKPTQRKVLFAAFKRNLKSDVKVAQFVGYISEQTAYHHGEVSLETTIVGMAQDYVGSNNINLLVPSGQFGTRLLGGKDHASSRYIFTRLSKATRAIFHPDDDGVYKYLQDEGQSIEPAFYVPVIPTVLVNGADGIGTGWSSSVPNYNPRDLVANLQRMLKGEKVEEMHPWYAGFSGSVQHTPKGYEITGKIAKTGPKTIEISELPIKVWTQDYKTFLQEMLAGNVQETKPKDADAAPEKEQLVIEDIKEYHTENTVHFELTLSEQKMQLAESMGLEKAFKIRRNGAATTNMMLFDKEGKVKKYASAEEILYDFADVRIDFYNQRKTVLCEKLLREKVMLDYKTKFIIMVIKKEIIISNRKKKDIPADLRRLKFPTNKQIQKLTLANPEIKFTDDDDDDDENEDDDDEPKDTKSGFNYLLGMPLWNLTFEKVEELKRLAKEKAEAFDAMMKIAPEQLWWADLEDLKVAMNELDEDRAAAAAETAKLKERVKAKPGQRAKGKGKGKRVIDSE